ncbi:mRNA-capping enzyme [Anaeramoeba flamelloides]|uniref:mRNA guanylyltransferase n=1 Tax=Anaeramoeba flamelloides TaxID=1746091 RepID=A0ABQ8X6L6_9EUKA|nr:mRNA-capping enzyme [Anaeramoeba flamelloides]
MDPHSKKARTLGYVSNKKVIEPLFQSDPDQQDEDRQLSSTHIQVLRTNENFNQNQTTNDQTENTIIENIVIENNPKETKQEETKKDLKQTALHANENNDQKEFQIQTISSQKPNSEQNQGDEKVNQQKQVQEQIQEQVQEKEKELEKENKGIKIEITTKKQQKIELIQEKPNEQLSVNKKSQEDQEKENNGIVELTNNQTSNVSTIKIITSQKQQNNLNGIQILKSTEEDSSRKRNLEDISKKINTETETETKTKNETKTKTKRNTKSLIQIAPKRSKFILPKGWEHTPRMGQKVEQTNIIPLKTPLDEKYQAVLKHENLFTPEMFLDFQKARKQPIGLVIDLTNTKRFYDSTIFINKGIEYKKIPCRGHREVPTINSVQEFISVVDDFVKRKPDSYIACHCTHGYNRTGYMIIHYLLKTKKSDLIDALNLFANSRNPGIYKKYYLSKLFKIEYKTDINTTIYPIPPLPDWKKMERDLKLKEQTQKQNEEMKEIIQEKTNGIAALPKNLFEKIGERVPKEEKIKLRKIICDLFNRPAYGNFPGAQPKSLDKEYLNYLLPQNYLVTWKADGTRSMFFIYEENCYLIDRNYNFFKVYITFPKNLSHTLIDGEMVEEPIKPTSNSININEKENQLNNTTTDNSQENTNNNTNTNSSNNSDNNTNSDFYGIENETKVRYAFLVYDLMYFQEKSYLQRKLNDRLGAAYHLIGLRKQNLSQDEIDAEPFEVRFKNMYDLKYTRWMLKEHSVKHETDGIIFTPINEPYIPSDMRPILKWKPPHLNTVDFWIREFSGSDKVTAGLSVMTSGREKEVAKIKFDSPEEKRKYLNKVAECSFDLETKIWKALRLRIDKNHSNGLSTYRSIMKSIYDHIREEDLLNFISSNCQLK